MSTGLSSDSYTTPSSNPASVAPSALPRPYRDSAPGWKEWILPILLFAATFLSATFAGLMYTDLGDGRFYAVVLMALQNPSILLLGLPFSFTLLTILLAHELGHYFACRYYRIRCTPPFFIPLPISIAGTLGAFIKIKSPFQNKQALFDVGVAGPLAGFVFLVPALVIGIANSQLIPKGSFGGGFIFGEPLVFQWVARGLLGYTPASQDMIAHPIAMAAWFGLLATCLNLLPIWQLDGGHIAYALLGRGAQKRLSVVVVVGLISVSFIGWPIPSYLVFGVLLLILGSRFRFYHPPTLSDDEKVGRLRIVIGLLALAIFILSFTPIPFAIA